MKIKKLITASVVSVLLVGGPALADDDIAGDDRLAAVLLDAEAAPRGVAPVARTAA